VVRGGGPLACSRDRDKGAGRDVAGLVVPRIGRLVETTVTGEPYRLLDASGLEVEPVGVFFRELLASGRSVATVRSYGMDLLRMVAVPRCG